MRMPLWAVSVAALVVLSGSAGCTASEPPRQSDRSSTQIVPSASHSSSPSPGPASESPSAVDPKDAAVRALSSSLSTLSAAMAELEGDTRLRTMRADVATPARQARAALEGVRTAAYPASSRNCSTIGAGVRSAELALGQANAAGAGVTAVAASLAKQRAAVVTARKTVQADLARLSLAMKQSTTLAGITPADVEAALRDADAAVSASATLSKELVAAITKAMASAADAAGTAREIAAKVC